MGGDEGGGESAGVLHPLGKRAFPLLLPAAWPGLAWPEAGAGLLKSLSCAEGGWWQEQPQAGLVRRPLPATAGVASSCTGTFQRPFSVLTCIKT